MRDARFGGADGRPAVRDELRGRQHLPTELHDSHVAGSQLVVAAVRDSTHRLPHRHVLRGMP
jgi:hypothetical protein